MTTKKKLTMLNPIIIVAVLAACFAIMVVDLHGKDNIHTWIFPSLSPIGKVFAAIFCLVLAYGVGMPFVAMIINLFRKKK